MIPEWAIEYLGAEGVAEVDSRSGESVAWGRQVTKEIPEGLFEKLRGEVDLVCVPPDWFVVERRLSFGELLQARGIVRAIGVGPSGGFKWVRLADNSVWSHKNFRDGVMKEARLNPRLIVKCDKDGYEKGNELRLPRLTVGYSAGRKRH